MQNYEAEKILLGAINEWLKEGNIKEAKINQTNLDRLNVANVMALKIFDGINKVEFNPPQQNLNFAESRLYYGKYIDIENTDDIAKKTLFERFIQVIDSYHTVSSYDGTTVYYTIDNVWEE